MRIADYLFHTLADWGVRHVFLVTGGGAMFLDDAVGREKRLHYICNLHEQACAMAAEGYARISGRPGVICVTTGPGGTNAITGVAGAWLDSVPMVILSGQVKVSTTIASCPGLPLRQLGDQELNIVDLVRPITKYAEMITDPARIPAALRYAWELAQSGRPGPVWLDIPLNIQSAELPGNCPADLFPAIPPPLKPQQELLDTFFRKLQTAERPVIVAGRGIRCAGAEKLLLQFAQRENIPVLTSISGIDLMASDHPLFFGRPGILGERGANFIMQNSDLLIALGTRMGIRIIGYAYESVARAACKVMVDTDRAELEKPTFRPDIRIHADAGEFLRAMLAGGKVSGDHSAWLHYCREVKSAYPVIQAEHRERTDFVSSYVFPELLARNAEPDSIIVTGNGTAYTSTFQAIPLSEKMRMFSNEACASMGYGLPAAIGAALAGNGREVLCLTGDGSLQMNLQELQTLVNYQLPLKLFVYNNRGYLSIKLTQKSFFQGHFVGSEENSGVRLPELEKLAAAYSLTYEKVADNREAAEKLPAFLRIKGPAVMEVMTDPFEVLGPKAASKRLPDGKMVSAPLEDLFPFLSREEFRSRMIIPPLDETF